MKKSSRFLEGLKLWTQTELQTHQHSAMISIIEGLPRSSIKSIVDLGSGTSPYYKDIINICGNGKIPFYQVDDSSEIYKYNMQQSDGVKKAVNKTIHSFVNEYDFQDSLVIAASSMHHYESEFKSTILSRISSSRFVLLSELCLPVEGENVSVSSMFESLFKGMILNALSSLNVHDFVKCIESVLSPEIKSIFQANVKQTEHHLPIYKWLDLLSREYRIARISVTYMYGIPILNVLVSADPSKIPIQVQYQ